MAVDRERDGGRKAAQHTSASSLALMSRAEEMLARASTIAEARELKNLALTAADWAKRKGLGQEAVRHCQKYALLAERKLGEMLAATERAPAGRKPENRSSGRTDSSKPTLEDLGISKNESAEAQKLAKLPEPAFRKLVKGETSKKQLFKELRREARRREAENTIEIGLPTGRFRVIYIDPPWQYRCSGDPDKGHADTHYRTLPLKEICALPVSQLAEKNAIIYLWVPVPLLPYATLVLDAWGFEFKGEFIWDKQRHNMGHYNSVRHERLIFAVRGSCLPDVPKLFDSVQSIPRGRHSEKPDRFREIIETLYTHGNKLEMFAREEHVGWTVHGNQIRPRETTSLPAEPGPVNSTATTPTAPAPRAVPFGQRRAPTG